MSLNQSFISQNVHADLKGPIILRNYISLDLGFPDFHYHLHRHYGNPHHVFCRVILNAHLR